MAAADIPRLGPTQEKRNLICTAWVSDGPPRAKQRDPVEPLRRETLKRSSNAGTIVALPPKSDRRKRTCALTPPLKKGVANADSEWAAPCTFESRLLR